jgi:hypothetical protein
MCVCFGICRRGEEYTGGRRGDYSCACTVWVARLMRARVARPENLGGRPRHSVSPPKPPWKAETINV